MTIIKFDLEKLKQNANNFNYYILGRSYDLAENGAKQDYNRALFYYREGLKNGYPLCIYSVGISYELGLEGVLPIDKQKAKILLTDAYPKILELISNPNINEIEKVYAKFITGAYYYYGLGKIDKDYQKAFQIIKECAEQGHIAAIYDLGANFYYNGIGTNKDNDLADFYLNLASENGLPRAISLIKTRKNSLHN
ncbi:MAG: sel1 repeat family protein [Bacilli bacterium]|nr:sel1 repeat family protein [Bacilli bacterium]